MMTMTDRMVPLSVSRRAIPVLLLLLALVAPGPALAQPGDDQPDRSIDATARAAVIDGALKHLEARYVFPEVAAKMTAAIRERVARKEYDSVTSSKELARLLTDHLQEVSHDKHLRVRYSYEPQPAQQEEEPPQAEVERRRRMSSLQNFGFERVERLPGNVGYLDLRGFNPWGGETAAAAMSFLANADAIIFDLRQNGGGSPAMVALLSSYLFDEQPVHLNSLYWREGDQTRQWWTLPYVPGRRSPDKDVYVLTSQRTFSAAEEFTYNLKSLKRATIVGETTGGGAHPGGPVPIDEHFHVWVPSGRAINPITGTNWEGTGVEPDVKVPADQALKTAHLLALQKSLERVEDEVLRRQLEGLIETTRGELDAMKGGSDAGPRRSR